MNLDPVHYMDMLFKQFPGGMWATDRTLHLTYVSGQFVTDIVPEAKPGMSIGEILGTGDAANRIIASHWAAISGESQRFEYEFGNRWYEVLMEPLVDSKGDISGCIAAAFDITERR